MHDFKVGNQVWRRHIRPDNTVIPEVPQLDRSEGVTDEVCKPPEHKWHGE